MFQFTSFCAGNANNESIYNLVAKCDRERCRPPRYVSRYACKVRQEAYCQKKGCSKTMGIPRTYLESPKCFMRKYSRTYPCFWKRPTGLKSKSCNNINITSSCNFNQCGDINGSNGQTQRTEAEQQPPMNNYDCWSVFGNRQHSSECCFNQSQSKMPLKSRSNPEIATHLQWYRQRNFDRHHSCVRPSRKSDNEFDQFFDKPSAAANLGCNYECDDYYEYDLNDFDFVCQEPQAERVTECCPECKCYCHINYPNASQNDFMCANDLNNNNCGDECDVQIGSRTPAGYSGGFAYIEKGRKDYIRHNALAVMRLPPKIPKKRIIDDEKGHRADWKGENMLKKKGFGQVPDYIECRKQELCNEALEMKLAVQRASKCSAMSDETRCLIIHGLELQWADVFDEYQHLPLFSSSSRILKLKGELENQLRDLEKDLQLFQRNGPLFIDSSIGAKSHYL